MKRTGVMIALASGLMTQGALAKTLNVVTSFSIGALPGGRRQECQRHYAGWAGWRFAYLRAFAERQRGAEKADVVVVNGLGLEGWLDRLVKASGFKGTLVVVFRRGEDAYAG